MNKKRVAVVDIGSNSIKILVAEGPGVTPVFEKTIETRISPKAGEPQDVISEHAMDSGIGAVAALLPHADFLGAEQVAIVATSMVREAKNGREFAEELLDGTGERLRILTGEEEAAGIAAGVATDPAFDSVKRLGIFDLGGGSLEFIHRVDGRVKTAVSHRVGAVRLTREFIKDPSSPIPAAELAALRGAVRDKFADVLAEATRGGPMRLAGCGGAFSAARAILGARTGLKAHDAPASVSVAQLRELLEETASRPLDGRIAIAGVPSARADVLPAGFAVLLEIAELAKADGFTHSWRNLRYGIAAQMLGGR